MFAVLKGMGREVYEVGVAFREETPMTATNVQIHHDGYPTHRRKVRAVAGSPRRRGGQGPIARG
jgi:hypothetical protein